MKHINVLAVAITDNKIKKCTKAAGDCRPCIAIFETDRPRRIVHGVKILGPSRVVFDPDGSPMSGALVYIETDAPLEIEE